MKKRIFRNFTIIICFALTIGSVMLYLVMSSILLEKEKENLMTTLKTLDYAQGDLLENDAIFKNFLDDEDERLTIIDEQGKVLLDSGVEDAEMMENHLQRDEVKEALRDGFGYDIRFSDTLKENMLYAAYYNESVHQIYRISTPYHGLAAYGYMLVPLLLMTLGVSLLISLWMAKRFSDNSVKPLEEIAAEIAKISKRGAALHFKNYDFEELRAITSALTQMKQELETTISRLEQEKLIRTEFFSNASHELKTPLTSIRGYAELLNSGMVKEEQYAQCIARIMIESDHMIELINDILMISRLEGKHMDAQATTFDLGALIQDIVDAQMPLALKDQIQVHTDLAHVEVVAAKRYMQELANNLITNALKDNRANGQVEIELTKEETGIKLIVEDSGIGISEENQARVFERFYRVDEGRDKKVGGSGLGLAIVKHIVHYYEGTLHMHSKLGIGTRITVHLPILAKQIDH